MCPRFHPPRLPHFHPPGLKNVWGARDEEMDGKRERTSEQFKKWEQEHTVVWVQACTLRESVILHQVVCPETPLATHVPLSAELELKHCATIQTFILFLHCMIFLPLGYDTGVPTLI